MRVSRRGVTVRARPEIAFLDPAPARTTRLTVTDLLASTEAATDLRLRIGGFTVRDADGKLRVGVVVEPVDPSVTLTSAGAILIDGGDRVVAHWFAKDATERPLLGAMAAPPGPTGCASRRSTPPAGRAPRRRDRRRPDPSARSRSAR